MAAYCRVYDSRHLQAITRISSGTLRLVIEYGLPITRVTTCLSEKPRNVVDFVVLYRR